MNFLLSLFSIVQLLSDIYSIGIKEICFSLSSLLNSITSLSLAIFHIFSKLNLLEQSKLSNVQSWELNSIHHLSKSLNLTIKGHFFLFCFCFSIPSSDTKKSSIFFSFSRASFLRFWACFLLFSYSSTICFWVIIFGSGISKSDNKLKVRFCLTDPEVFALKKSLYQLDDNIKYKYLLYNFSFVQKTT